MEYDRSQNLVVNSSLALTDKGPGSFHIEGQMFGFAVFVLRSLRFVFSFWLSYQYFAIFAKTGFLRKGIKIKASLILLSWLMIFAHGIIPHSHADDIPFHHESHNKGCIEESENIVLKPHTGDENGCRISNVLFHKFSQDDQQSILNSCSVSLYLLASRPVIYNNNYSFLSGRFSDSESLRAPPGA